MLKFIVHSPLNHLALVQHDNFVTVPDGGKAVGRDQTGSAPPPQGNIDLLWPQIKKNSV